MSSLGILSGMFQNETTCFQLRSTNPVFTLRSVIFKGIDVVTMMNYSDLTVQSLNYDPIIVLECGHPFLMSALDAYMEITQFYERAERGDAPGRFKWIRPIGGERLWRLKARKTCPFCQTPITSIRRYGRIIKKTSLDSIETAFHRKYEETLCHLNRQLQSFVQGNEESSNRTKRLFNDFLNLAEATKKSPLQKGFSFDGLQESFCKAFPSNEAQDQ